MILQLKQGDKYTFDDFVNFKDDTIFAYPTYGNNEVRNGRKIIELNDILIEDVDLIKIDTSGGFVVMDLCNSFGKCICRKLMKWAETLEINGFESSPVYEFVN